METLLASMKTRGLKVALIGLIFGIALLSPMLAELMAQGPEPVHLTVLRGDTVLGGGEERHTICVRWSFDPEQLLAGGFAYGFPNIGFTVWRRAEGGAWKSISDRPFTEISPNQPTLPGAPTEYVFNLPETESGIHSRLNEIEERVGNGHLCPDVRDQHLINSVRAMRNDDQIASLLNTIQAVTDAGEDALDMDKASRSPQPGAPSEFDLPPVDRLLLASIDPVAAQVLGLLYVDQNVEPGVTYEYRVTALGDAAFDPTDPPNPLEEEVSEEGAPIVEVGPDPHPALVEPQNVNAEVRTEYVYSNALNPSWHGEEPPPNRTLSPVPTSLVVVAWERISEDEEEVLPVGYHVLRKRDDESDYRHANIHFKPRDGDSEQIEASHELVPVDEDGDGQPDPFLVLDQEQLKGCEEEVQILIYAQGEQPGGSEAPTPCTGDPDERAVNFSDPNLVPNEEYVYKVVSVDLFGRRSGESDPTDGVGIPLPEPPAPTGLCVAAPEDGVPTVKSTISGQHDPSQDAGIKNECDPIPIQPRGTGSWNTRLRWNWSEQLDEKYQIFGSYEIQCAYSASNRSGTEDIGFSTGKCPEPINDFTPSINADLSPVAGGGIVTKTIPIELVGNSPITHWFFRVRAVNETEFNEDGSRCESECVQKSSWSSSVSVAVSDQVAPPVSCPVEDRPDPTPRVPNSDDLAEFNERVTMTPDRDGLLAVRLEWEQVDNVDGYHVYRQICPKTGGCQPDPEALTPEMSIQDPPFQRRNPELIPQTPGPAPMVYRDRIEASAVKNRFRYAVKAVDAAGNISDFSCPSEVFRLPKTPEVPVIETVDANPAEDFNRNGRFDPGFDFLPSFSIKWSPNPEETRPIPEDALARLTEFRIYRGEGESAREAMVEARASAEPIKEGIAPFDGGVDAGSDTRHDSVVGGSDNFLKPRKWYCYTVEAENGYDRTARSNPKCAQGPLEFPFLPAPQLSAAITDESGALGLPGPPPKNRTGVRLSWNYQHLAHDHPLRPFIGENLEFSVWRRANSYESFRAVSQDSIAYGLINLFRSRFRIPAILYVDEDVHPGDRFCYQVKVRDGRGNENVSNEVCVTKPAETALTGISVEDVAQDRARVDFGYRCVFIAGASSCSSGSRLEVRVLRDESDEESATDAEEVPYFASTDLELVPSKTTDAQLRFESVEIQYGADDDEMALVARSETDQESSSSFNRPRIDQAQGLQNPEVPRSIETHFIEMVMVDPQGEPFFSKTVPFQKVWRLPLPQLRFDLPFELESGSRPLIIRDLPRDVANTLRQLGVDLAPDTRSFELDEEFRPAENAILDIPPNLEFDRGTGKVSGRISRRARPGLYQTQWFALAPDGERVARLLLSIRLFLTNQAPIPDPGGPYEAFGEPDVADRVSATIDFDGTGSRDPDGEIVLYQWRFGDGERGQGAQVSHTYTLERGLDSKEFTVCLTVVDDVQSRASDCTTATVERGSLQPNQPPAADPGGPYQEEGFFNQANEFGATIELDGRGSSDPDGEIVDYSWDLGDGSTGDEARLLHFYDGDPQQDTTYEACLTVTDDDGADDTACTSVTILQQSTPNQPPVALTDDSLEVQGAFVNGAYGADVTLNGTESFDPDGEIVDFHWDFGDGETGNSATVTHFYAGDPDQNTMYQACLTVTDDEGATDTSCVDVTILKQNEGPVAVAILPDEVQGEDNQEGTFGATIEVDGEESFDSDGTIVGYRWWLSEDGSTLSTEARDEVFIEGDPNGTQDKDVEICLTVTDDDGAEDTECGTVTVEGEGPI